jgi:putative ABC transport system ATP-binding protein
MVARPQSSSGDAESSVVVEGVSVSYKAAGQMVRALDNVTVSLAQGRWTAIVGPSGSGKSTLLHVIAGLQRPEFGTATVCGVRLESLDQSQLARFRLGHVGFVFQAFHLLPHLEAWENVALPLVAVGTAPAERRARALRLLDEVELSDRAHHRPVQLSGGEQQRVALARALVNHPDLIIADELTGNLDAGSALAVLDLLGRSLDRGTTVVCATHDMTVAARADRVLHLRHGLIASDSARA